MPDVTAIDNWMLTEKCECGSTDLCIARRVPVFTYLSEGSILRVLVTDEQVISGVVRCLTCDRFWTFDA